MAPATMTSVAAVAWAGDFVQKRDDEIGKCSSQHLTVFLCFDLSLFSR
jgi:hypothetical protein